MPDITWIEKEGPKAQGKKELVAYLKGERLTLREAKLANCYSLISQSTKNRF